MARAPASLAVVIFASIAASFPPAARAAAMDDPAYQATPPPHRARMAPPPIAMSTPAHLATGADGAWNEVPPPVGREAMVYDPVRGRMIIFGGWPDDTPAGVWTVPVTGTPRWTFVPTTGVRPQLSDVSAIYDPPRDRLVVYASDGLNASVVWTLSLASMAWTELTPAGTPPPYRWGEMSIFDPLRNRMILFGGGEGYSSQYNDTWALSLDGPPVWTELHPAGPLPMGRQYAGCVYDPIRDRMVIFAGVPNYDLTAYTDLNDVWALSFANPTWTQLQPAGTLPAAGYFVGAVYDPVRDRMLVSGGTAITPSIGIAGQTWSLDLVSPQWTQLTTTGSPRGGGRTSTYDSLNDRLVSYGAGNIVALALPGLVWSRLVVGAGRYPAPRNGFVLTPDPARGRMLLTGGLGLNDYWPYWDDYYVNVYTPATGIWGIPLDQSVPYTSRPKARSDHSAVVDDNRSRLILFGGFEDNASSGPYGNDTWAMTLAPTVGWSQLAPAGTLPSGRAGQSTIVDPAGDRMLIFGGTDATHVLNDVWALGFAGPQWTALAPSGTPPPARQRAAAFYDPVGRRMILFGGLDQPRVYPGHYGSTFFNDLWALNLSGSSSWTPLSPVGTPPPPTPDPIAVFDLDRNRAEILTDAGVWSLELSDPPRWTPLDISGSVLGTLGRGSAVYDPSQHRVLALPAQTETLWSLDFPLLPTAVEVSVARAEASAGRISVEWATLAPALLATVERSVAGGGWEERKLVIADARGRIAFEDAEVRPAGRYGYRLRFAQDGTVRRAGEVWVDVPAVEFALRGAQPNPAGADPLVAFSLPGPGPARLELLDLTGRQLATREVGELGAGSHVASLAPRTGLAPGIYIVRLTRDGRSLTARIAVIR